MKKELLLELSKRYIDYITTLLNKSLEDSYVNIESKGDGIMVDAHIGSHLPFFSNMLTELLRIYILVMSVELTAIFEEEGSVPLFSLKFTKLKDKVLIINTLEIDNLMEEIM